LHSFFVGRQRKKDINSSRRRVFDRFNILARINCIVLALLVNHRLINSRFSVKVELQCHRQTSWSGGAQSQKEWALKSTKIFVDQNKLFMDTKLERFIAVQ